MKKKISLGFLGAIGFVSVLWAAYPYSSSRWKGTGATQNVTQFEITTPSSGSNAVFQPGATNTNALGTTSRRFSNVHTTYVTIAPTLDITVTTPTVVGQLGVSSAGLVYVATTTANVQGWQKVGAQ